MEDLREQYEAKVAEAEAILDAAATEKRGLNADETKAHDGLVAEARGLRQLITRKAETAKEREEIVPELRSARAAVEGAREERAETPRVEVTHRDPGHYTKRSDLSWFVDKANAELKGDSAARQRLEETSAAVRDELANDTQKRDLYNAATAGQEIVPPLYLTDLFVEGRVAGAVTAGLCNQLPLPPAGRSVTVPKMTGNTGVGIQTEASPLTALTETDATTNEETQGIYEIAGVQDLSNFLVDRSTPGADMVIMRNLAKQVAAKLDYYVLHGDGSGEPQGIRGATGINAVTYTSATPTFAEAQAKLADAIQQVHAGWFESPDAIVVHPRRWAKWMSERDSDGRPLGSNAAYAVNPLAVGQIGGTPQGGPAGFVHGIPVYLDSNISTTLGAGTNEDTVYAFVRSQALLWTGALNLEIDRSVNFKTSGVAVRARQYAAFMVEHAPEAFATLSGTGLAAPTFA
jgi:HK97 family phage major capsid protein